jgi:hypothetical protein
MPLQKYNDEGLLFNTNFLESTGESGLAGYRGELALEKSDFKGQSAADKVLTLYRELTAYKPKYPSVSLDEALANTTGAVREARFESGVP